MRNDGKFSPIGRKLTILLLYNYNISDFERSEKTFLNSTLHSQHFTLLKNFHFQFEHVFEEIKKTFLDSILNSLNFKLHTFKKIYFQLKKLSFEQSEKGFIYS